MFKRLIMSSLVDWRQRLHYTHPDFKPGFIFNSAGIAEYYIDEEGREFLTTEGLLHYIESKQYKESLVPNGEKNGQKSMGQRSAASNFKSMVKRRTKRTTKRVGSRVKDDSE